MRYSELEKNLFLDCVDSLKKYQRAELFDEKGKDILQSLYTDLLPDEQILKQCLKSNTTFLIGRKGTGKSTIFLRMQQEIRKKDNYLSCYIDTKTISETSEVKNVSSEHLKKYLPSNVLQKYLLERTFIQNMLIDVIKEIDKRSINHFERLKKLVGVDKATRVKIKLKALLEDVKNNEKMKSIEIPVFQEIITRIKEGRDTSEKSKFDAGLKFEPNNFGGEISKGNDNEEKISREIEKEFSDVLFKVFDIYGLILQIKDILSELGIRNLFVILDDFSEIEDDSMKIFVDVILAPLNNWSDQFIKFKVAAYPNREYYGKLDKGKIDIIDLDFFSLYSRKNRDTMEERAIDFTKRLLENRVGHFTEKPIAYFFDTRNASMVEYYELIFQISMNVPRIIGYVLYYCFESSIAFNTPISRSDLTAASERYFEKNVFPFFDSTAYSLVSYNEKISTLQLKNLLVIFTEKLKEIKRRIKSGELTSEVYIESRGNPYCSHFFFKDIYEEFIKTLELNFFITKYNELSDRDGGGIKHSIYCINYGLAVKNNLKWGKPKGSDYRKYFIARPFDFNKIMDEFLRDSKTIKCINHKCNKIYSYEELEFLKWNKMTCTECHSPVRIISTSESIKKEIESIDKSILLPKLEFDILREINNGKGKPKDIARELDSSYQLIGKKAKRLDEEDKLIIRTKVGNNKRLYQLTDKAKKTYFTKK